MTQAVVGTGTLRQLAALFRMELAILRRNKPVALLVVMLPLAVGFLRLSGQNVATVGASAAVTRMAGTIGIILVLFLHHHLVTVYAARRQELVLKRLRAGLASDWTILAGAASTVVLFLGQVLLLAAYGVFVLDLPVPANPLTVLLAVLLAAALMAAFSAAMSAVTRSSEAAMLTTVPTTGIFLATPGMLVPFGSLPRGVEQAAWFLPMGPFPEVIRNGWLGRDAGGAELTFLGSVVGALPALAVMSGWLVLAALGVRWFFRWEPRHG